MSNVVFGSNAFMECKVGGVYKPVGCAITCSFTFQNELIGKTDRNAGLFRKRRVRISDMSASVSGLTTLVTDTTISILYFLQEGVRRTEQDFRFSFTDEAGEQRQVQGIFLVESIEISADTASFSESDLNLSGTGGFAITSVDPDNPTELGAVVSDWWETTPGGNTISGSGSFNGFSFAGHEVIEVDREGTQYDQDDTTGDRKYTYNGTTITFDPTNPFNAGERVFVIFQIVES